jgi:beta-glucosidase
MLNLSVIPVARPLVAGESMKKFGSGVVAAAAVIAAIAGAPAGAAETSACPWMDAAKAPEQRADMLVKAMSFDQKLHMTTFSEPQWFAHYGTAGHVDAIPELCIPEINMSDAGSGIVGLQQGTTVFPSGIAQAAMWDPSMARRFGKAIGEEAFAKGINVILGPGMDTARIATNGRNFEYMGEDPFLGARTASAAIEGIQSNPVLAQAKHYVLNDQEFDRNTVDVTVDDRTLHEIYLAPFEAAVKDGKVGSVMCSYNLAFGHHVCESKQLLDGILRDQWGFDGFVTSDWGATHSTAPSANAGLDLEMHAAPPHYYGSALGDAINAGEVPTSRLDAIVKHIFVPMFRFGLFNHPPVGQPDAYLNGADTPAHHSLAREISEQSTVLLKNKGNLLPLDTGKGRTIAVIGSAANSAGASGNSGGGGSSHGTGLPSPVSPLEGIQRQAATRGDKVVYTPGTAQADAAAAAQGADIAIVVIGDTESEGSDRTTLDAHPAVGCVSIGCGGYGEDENALVDTVATANPNTVVVIDAGAPVSMPWLGKVASVLDAWYPGVENGNAIADVIYGVSNPSGHLPQTFPKTLADMPTKTPEQYPGVNDKVKYTEGLQVGYRYFDANNVEPMFPFGFGLSYTTFKYSGLKLKSNGKTARATFKLTNTGKRAGADVAQLYVSFPKALGEPPRQLKGFRKVHLRPGESQRVTIALDKRAFSYWDSAKQRWYESRGCFGLSVGDSSRSLPLSKRLAIRGANCKRKRR